MAHFYSVISGNKGEASRMGDKKSGMSARINGWDLGIEVLMVHNAEQNRDEAAIYLTGGSNSNGHARHIGTFAHGMKLTKEACESRVDPRLRVYEARKIEEV